MRPSLCFAEAHEQPEWDLIEPAGDTDLSVEAMEMLCDRWLHRYDITAARQLADAHLHLVVATASAYRSYGLSLEDMIGEGFAGMMRAICRFDPAFDVSLGTYVSLWIQATIQEHILGKLAAGGRDRGAPG